MSKAKEKAKARQMRILEFMRKEFDEKGYAPTVREIGLALDIKSTSTVHKDLECLAEQGYVKKDPAKPRTLVIVGRETRKVAKEPELEAVTEETVQIPIVGHIAAGIPITAEQNIEDSFPVPARYVSGQNFMLKVRGESMINVGIFDGDLILVEQRSTARNGEIVVAMVDGFESEATVKTFYKEKDHIRLQPENDDMSPILVRDVKILGKVKGVFRYYS
ncbi:MAG: transcriptional repressor LexA [Eubacterium sp.]|nr:transcriptional repressor LexA [Eubacterium sp.]